jgi:hypothetical protein
MTTIKALFGKSRKFCWQRTCEQAGIFVCGVVVSKRRLRAKLIALSPAQCARSRLTIWVYRSPSILSNQRASRKASTGSRSYAVLMASLSQKEIVGSARISLRFIPPKYGRGVHKLRIGSRRTSKFFLIRGRLPIEKKTRRMVMNRLEMHRISSNRRGSNYQSPL